jgi:hypothetical protein
MLLVTDAERITTEGIDGVAVFAPDSSLSQKLKPYPGNNEMPYAGAELPALARRGAPSGGRLVLLPEEATVRATIERHRQNSRF